jgi:hypothetical protein
MNKDKRKKKTKYTMNLEKKTNRITGNSKHLSIITLNVNGFNSPIKRHRLSD